MLLRNPYKLYFTEILCTNSFKKLKTLLYFLKRYIKIALQKNFYLNV